MENTIIHQKSFSLFLFVYKDSFSRESLHVCVLDNATTNKGSLTTVKSGHPFALYDCNPERLVKT